MTLSSLSAEADPFDEELERFAEGMFKMVFKMALDLPAKGRARAFAAAAQSLGFLVGCVVENRGGTQLLADMAATMRQQYFAAMTNTPEMRQAILRKTFDELNEEMERMALEATKH